MKLTKTFLLENSIEDVKDFYNHLKKNDPNESDELKNLTHAFLVGLDRDNNQLYISTGKNDTMTHLYGVVTGYKYASCYSNNNAVQKLQRWANENNFKIVDKK